MSWYPEDDPRNKPYAMDWNFTPEGRKLSLERYYLAPTLSATAKAMPMAVISRGNSACIGHLPVWANTLWLRR